MSAKSSICPTSSIYTLRGVGSEKTQTAGLIKMTPAQSFATVSEYCFQNASVLQISDSEARFSFDPVENDPGSHTILVNAGGGNIPLLHDKKTYNLVPSSWLVLRPRKDVQFDLAEKSDIVIVRIDSTLWRPDEINICAGEKVKCIHGTSNLYFYNVVCTILKSRTLTVLDLGNIAIMLMSSLRLSKPYLTKLLQEDGYAPLYWRALDHISLRFRDPDFTPDVAASELGVSRRRLDSAFQGTHDTVDSAIWNERLASAYADTCDPNQKDKTLALIAVENGFRSPSHFSRSYKKKYGVTPSDNFKNSFVKSMQLPNINEKYFEFLEDETDIRFTASER